MTGPRLECEGVNVRFGGLVALAYVDLAVPAAGIVGLVGPNGAGKSTLFGVLSGLIAPSTGRVRMDGEDVTGLRPQQRAARGLARTFQHPELFAGLTVRDHLVLAHRVRHAKARVWSDLFTMGSLRASSREETAGVDALVGLLGLESIADRPALGLPLGSARLVELGRALATSPGVLLLDEPSSGLDSAETDRFEQTLRRIVAERDISVLLVEHDVDLVMRLSSTVYVLDFGVMIAQGSPAEVKSDPRVKAAYLGEEVAPRTEAGGGPEAPETKLDGPVPDRVRTSGGTPAVPTAGTSTAPAALTVEDLCVQYGDAVALSGVSFSVGPGRVVAVLGPNGAGKSSLARAVSGLVRPSAGRVMFGEQDLTAWPAHRVRHAGIVYLPEVRGVFRALSVIDNLRMALATVRGRRRRREAVESALEIFPALAARGRQLAGSLSGGEQQMLSLARVLAASPKVVVADEMSLGLAPMMVDLVFDGLARAREAGVSVIMIEQYVHRALAFADECVILQRGALAWKGPSAEAGDELVSSYLGETMTVGS